jgi:hypothetical protein
MLSSGIAEAAMGNTGGSTWKGLRSWTPELPAPEALEDEEEGLCAIVGGEEAAEKEDRRLS